MNEYLHGAYGQSQVAGSRVSDGSMAAIVYVGTAPVHLIEGGGDNVNKPVVVRNIAEAKKLFGYSDDWSEYTLCEPMKAHFENNGVGPLVLINVLDPATHVEEDEGTVSLTPENGRVVIASAEGIVLDSLVVKSGATTKVKGTDYAVAYNMDRQTITLTELSAGSLGSTALTITYNVIDASAVDADDVIGATDGAGTNTGLYAMKNVYQMTGFVPGYLAAPGWSSIPTVHAAMLANAHKVNNHWDAYLFVDLPLTNGGSALTLDTVATWKDTNGYNGDNETVYFPMAEAADGKIYHLSVLAAANFQSLLYQQDGIPFKTASNTDCPVIQNLYMGADNTGKVYDDSIINEKLNKNGIASAAYIGGRWAIWGAHSASYTYANGDLVNVAETNRMMLFYLSNDFQHRRALDVDKPMTMNDLKTIASEEQSRLDALLSIGALTYGRVEMNASSDLYSDMLMGDYSFTFDITTTPLAKSLKAIVNWTDEGFQTYFMTQE